MIPASLPMGGKSVLVVPCMRVDDVSALSGTSVIGPPPPSTFLGWGHFVERKLGAGPVRGVAIGMHSFSMHQGFPKIPVDDAGAARSGVGAGPIIEAPRARMVASLLLALDIPREEVPGVAARAAAMLFGMRFAGGVIVGAGVSGAADGTPGPAVIGCADPDSFRRVVFSLPGCAFLRDRSDLFQNGRDCLDTLLDAVGRTEVHEGVWRRGQRGWVVPIQKGFRAISKVAQRRGARDSDGVQGHVWAEEILGLGEWVSRARAWSSGMQGVFWSHTADPERGLYEAVAH